MSERDRFERQQQQAELQARLQGALFDELWPVPEPPPDLAARVVARMNPGARGAVPQVIARDVPAPLPRRRLLPLALAGVAAAAALALWLGRSAPDRVARDSLDEEANEEPNIEGQVLAHASETVAIGARAAAAVEPGTELAWSVRQRQARVDQKRGSVLYRVRKGGPFRVITPAGDVEVTGTSFRVTTGRPPADADTLVVVLEGSVKVHSGAGTRALTAGQTARLTPGQDPELVLPEAPDPSLKAPPAERPAPAANRGPSRAPAALLLPHAPRLQVHGTGLRQVSLALPPGRPAAVEVARDARFTQPLFRGPAPGGFVTVPAPAHGDLYWRAVGAEDAAHARFSPAPAAPGLASPRNLVTQERESTTIHFQSAPPALTLAWPAVTGARSYRVRLTRASEPQRLLLERMVLEPRCAIAPGSLAEGSYLWSVVPDGAPAPTLAARRLDLVYDNALSTLTIRQPRPGDVQGVAPLGARLFVNGKAAAVDDKGRFSLRVPRSTRTLIFRLLEKDGAESYWVRPLVPRS
jgi:hypothetical protein